MKAHIGVDAKSGLVHSLVGTAVNVGDVTQTEHLQHGDEKAVFLDAGYVGAEKRDELKDKDVLWHIAMKRGKLKAMPAASERCKLFEKLEKMKASVRARVEHAFHVPKNLLHFRKLRYKGLKKSTAPLHSLFGQVNRDYQAGVVGASRPKCIPNWEKSPKTGENPQKCGFS